MFQSLQAMFVIITDLSQKVKGFLAFCSTFFQIFFSFPISNSRAFPVTFFPLVLSLGPRSGFLHLHRYSYYVASYALSLHPRKQINCCLFYSFLGQHHTIPALRLKHRSGSCGTASALPKCSIMSGCGTRIVLRGQKPLALCDRCPLLRFAVSATGGAHLCSIQYYLRFWLGICRTSLAVSALRIMRYCPIIRDSNIGC